MICVGALDELKNGVVGESVFLAGGVTNCPNWQQEICSLLQDTNLILFNPKYEDLQVGNVDAELELMMWECIHLRMVDAILFWFPCETLCPMTLYELGAWSMTEKPIFVGVHPDYKRGLNVQIQTRFARPKVEIAYSLQGLAQQVIEWSC